MQPLVPLVHNHRPVGGIVVFVSLRDGLLRVSELACNTAPFRWMDRVRSRGVRFPHPPNGVDALHDRLEAAKRRVAECERLVTGWRDVMERQPDEGRDVIIARDLVETFQAGLARAIRDKVEAEQALRQRFLDLFVGANGRAPNTDDELDQWLASAEGKAATAFEPTPLPPRADIGSRS